MRRGQWSRVLERVDYVPGASLTLVYWRSYPDPEAAREVEPTISQLKVPFSSCVSVHTIGLQHGVHDHPFLPLH